METSIAYDAEGREVLVRGGTGVVTAVQAVGMADDDNRYPRYRVEIAIDPDPHQPRIMRFSAQPTVDADSPLYAMALQALRDKTPVSWQIEWRRHEWIPGDLPIGALNLVTDSRSVLTEMALIEPLEPVDADSIPDFIPATWTS